VGGQYWPTRNLRVMLRSADADQTWLQVFHCPATNRDEIGPLAFL